MAKVIEGLFYSESHEYVIGLQFDKDFADNDQGHDFNGMTFDELEAKYGKYVEELKRKEREEA